MSNRPVIGITMGDPSGIGPEVTLKALSEIGKKDLAKITVIGSGRVLSGLSRQKRFNFELVDLDGVCGANFAKGKISPISGRAAIGYLDKALELLRQKEIGALVTAPVSKAAINLSGIRFSGHTEYLAAKTKTVKFAMMFTAGNFKVTLVTRHIPLKKVAASINQEKIFQAISLTADFLRKYYRVDKPRIAVCGLNPHAGEGGVLGGEEKRLIAPAIKKASRKYRHIYGPLPADTVFLQAKTGRFDAVVAMYHDQGMIPVKTLFLNSSVNVTLGLPFVRTSPCHGTAFDIAGKNRADAASMRSAINLAIALAGKSLC